MHQNPLHLFNIYSICKDHENAVGEMIERTGGIRRTFLALFSNCPNAVGLSRKFSITGGVGREAGRPLLWSFREGIQALDRRLRDTLKSFLTYGA